MANHIHDLATDRIRLIQANSSPRCRHIKVNGTQCHSPALRDEAVCFYHYQQRLRPKKLRLPVLEDTVSVQSAIGQVCQAAIDGALDPKIASLVLFGLQTASSNCRHTLFEPAAHEVVTDVVHIPDPTPHDHETDDATYDNDDDEDDEDETDDETDDDDGEDDETEANDDVANAGDDGATGATDETDDDDDDDETDDDDDETDEEDDAADAGDDDDNAEDDDETEDDDDATDDDDDEEDETDDGTDDDETDDDATDDDTDDEENETDDDETDDDDENADAADAAPALSDHQLRALKRVLKSLNACTASPAIATVPNDQRPTTNDQRPTTNDQRLATSD